MTYVISDKLAALTPEGEELILFDDGDPARVAEFDRHFFAGTVTPEIMMATHGSVAPWMASLTFGGADLRTCYVGSLRGTTLPCFTAPVAGLPLAHWQDR
jgi:hypothetical protein